MQERPFWKKLKEEVSKHVVVTKKQRFGIDTSFVFIKDNSPEAWRETIKDWEPEKRLVLRPIVTEAIKRERDERTSIIENLCKTDIPMIKIGKDARKKKKARYGEIEAIINIFSMSDINIQNLAEALEIEVEVD